MQPKQQKVRAVRILLIVMMHLLARRKEQFQSGRRALSAHSHSETRGRGQGGIVRDFGQPGEREGSC